VFKLEENVDIYKRLYYF